MASITSRDFENNGFFARPESIDLVHPAYREPPNIDEDDADDPSSLTAGLSATIPRLAEQWPADHKYEGGSDKIGINPASSGLIPATAGSKMSSVGSYEQDEKRVLEIPQPSRKQSDWSVSSGSPEPVRLSTFPPPPTAPPSIPVPPIPGKYRKPPIRESSAAPPHHTQKSSNLKYASVMSAEDGGDQVFPPNLYPPSPPESSASSARLSDPLVGSYPYPRHPPPPPSLPNRNVYSPTRTPHSPSSKSSYYTPSLVRRPASPLSAIASVTSSTPSVPGEMLDRTSSQMQTLSSSWSMSSIGSQPRPSRHGSGSSDGLSVIAPSTTSSGRRTLTSLSGRSRLRSMLQKSSPPLILAVKAGNLPEVQNMLAPGLRTTPVGVTDKDGLTSLHHAAMDGHEAICETLLTHSALTEARTKYQKRTPLYFASSFNHPNIVALLLASGAAPNARSTMDGATALHKAAQKGHVEVMEMLIDAGADVDLSDVEGMRPLLWATQGKQIEAAKLLVNSGANMEARINLGKNLELTSREGLTVLHKAVGSSDYPFAELFVSLGADINGIGAHGIKPLHRACARGDARMVDMLLNNGADPKEPLGEEGWTPLHWTARYGHRRVALILLARGAWAGARTTSPHGAASGEGETARELALRYGHHLNM